MSQNNSIGNPKTATPFDVKNLDIVMECSEITEENQERQALLNPKNKIVGGIISADGTITQSRDGSTNPAIQTSDMTISHETNEDEESPHSIGIKSRKRNLQQSRVERSRLSLITFLNNITAPPNRTESTSSGLRSQSISTIRLQEKDNEQKSNKQHCGRTPHQQQHSSETQQEIPPPVIDEQITAETNENLKEVEVDLTSSHAPADKLSIKSGVSMAASSNSGPSESLFSAGSGQSLSGGTKSQKHRECSICCVRQQAANFQRLKCCPHLACKHCLVKYLTTEIMESRTNISCPECPQLLHASDIYALLSNQPDLLERFELFSLRRVLSADPDTRWCPAPDCMYAVIANSCAACPQLKCEKCDTMFCYHCKNYWHPSQTCDQARAKSFFPAPVVQAVRSSLPTDADIDVMKACPRCGAIIMKMNDGSCNHMQCALCNAEFCWLCLKQINELHYLSPTGCTFWGKKPWTRKKKLLWQIGTLIGAPLGIALIAGLAVPGIICGVPIFVGRKTYQRFSNLTRTKRQLVTALSVFGSLIVSPVLAVMTVGVGVPIMLAYVYGVVPLSLCRNGACGGTSSSDDANGDEEVAYGEEVLVTTFNKTRVQQQEEKKSFHQRRQSIASSGLVSLTGQPNTEDASIQAIAGSQYNYDNRSVHTIWSSGQYGARYGESGAMELASQEATSYNNDDAENASTLACCSASIVAQASERRSLTGSSGSFKTRPRSSISNKAQDSRGTSEEPGKSQGKFIRKVSRNNTDGGKSNNVETFDRVRIAANPSMLESASTSAPAPAAQAQQSPADAQQEGPSKGKTSRFRSFIRHPIDTLFAKKKNSSNGI